MLADSFHIRNQGLCGVVCKFGMGYGSSGATLIKENNAIALRIKKLPVVFLTTCTRTTMDEYNGDTVWFTAFLYMQNMWRGDG